MVPLLLPMMAGLAISIPAAPAADRVLVSQAVLATPSASAPFILDGRRWSCEGAICTGRTASAPASQPALRECRRFVRRAGAVVEYRQNGYALNATELTRCNAVLTGV